MSQKDRIWDTSLEDKWSYTWNSQVFHGKNCLADAPSRCSPLWRWTQREFTLWKVTSTFYEGGGKGMKLWQVSAKIFRFGTSQMGRVYVICSAECLKSYALGRTKGERRVWTLSSKTAERVTACALKRSDTLKSWNGCRWTPITTQVTWYPGLAGENLVYKQERDLATLCLEAQIGNKSEPEKSSHRRRRPVQVSCLQWDLL